MRAQRSSRQGVPEYHWLRQRKQEVREAILRRSGRTIFLSFLALLLLALSGRALDATTRAAARRGRPGRVQTGLDVLEAQKFAPLKGKRVGLITNHTGLDAQEKTTIDRLAHAPGVTLVALFSPEHGLAGKLDANVVST